ncbi:hypothetical protein Tco_0608646 [Tanacetum coccineum]
MKACRYAMKSLLPSGNGPDWCTDKLLLQTVEKYFSLIIAPIKLDTFLGVNVNYSTVNHVTEELYPGDPEFTLGELAYNSSFSKQFQDLPKAGSNRSSNPWEWVAVLYEVGSIPRYSMLIQERHISSLQTDTLNPLLVCLSLVWLLILVVPGGVIRLSFIVSLTFSPSVDLLVYEFSGELNGILHMPHERPLSRQVHDKWYQEQGRFEVMTIKTEKNGASGSMVVDENRGRDDARQHPKKRGTSKDVVASLDKRVAGVDTSMAELDFTSMREDFRVSLNTFSGDLMLEICGVRDMFMDEITKIRTEFEEEISTLHQTIEDLQADVALCKRSLASGGDTTNHGPKLDVPKPSPFLGKREARAVDVFLWEMEQYLEGVDVVDDASKIKMATRYLKDTASLCW